MATNYSTTGEGLLPSGVLQPYGQNILKYGIGQLGTPIDVSKLTPQVAGQSAFQQQAAQGIADLGGLGTVQRDASGQVTGFTGGTGVASYQPYLDNISQQNLLDPGQGYQQFMSPYQQEIINTTLADFDRQAQIGQQTVSDAAYTAGAFGGGREGVQRSAYQLPLDRITDVSNIYGSVAGAMPGSPSQKFTPNPILTGIGGFANMYTTLGGNMMNQNNQQNQNV